MLALARDLRIALRATLALAAPLALLAWGRAARPPAAARPLPVAAVPHIPLCAGLTIVTAVSEPEGDYESIKTVETADPGGLTLRYTADVKFGGSLRTVRSTRRVLGEDLRRANLFLRHFSNRGAVTVPGTTAIGTSGAVLRALRGAGVADLGIFDPVAAAAPANRDAHPNVYDYQEVERIRRVGTDPVQLPVLVNEQPATLPAIEARGDYTGDKADFLFLDDDANPLVLRYRVGKDALDVVKITYHCTEPPGSAAGRLEQSLLRTGRADIYSIYFTFNSDQLREESDSTLQVIAEVLRRHPDWKLAINGHTDAIGGDAYNLALSGRRAAAVKAALVARCGVAPARLTTAGYGKRSPKDTNETLEGRARNRRVELVRLP